MTFTLWIAQTFLRINQEEIALMKTSIKLKILQPDDAKTGWKIKINILLKGDFKIKNVKFGKISHSRDPHPPHYGNMLNKMTPPLAKY